MGAWVFRAVEPQTQQGIPQAEGDHVPKQGRCSSASSHPRDGMPSAGPQPRGCCREALAPLPQLSPGIYKPDALSSGIFFSTSEPL